MNTTVKAILWIVVLLLIVWGISAAVGKDDEVAMVEGPVKIGVILPLTGDAASYGEPGRNLIALAAEKINAEGGINNNPIELIFEDGKCTGKDAANAAQKLVNVDKVEAIIGGFCSSESLAAEPIATEAKVTLFSPGSSNPGLTGISPFFVRNYPSDSSQGTILAEVAVKESFKKVAILQEQTDYCVGITGSFSDAFTEKGGEAVKEEFATGQTDLRSSLTKLRGANPDALFLIVQTPASAERVFKQLRDLGWKPKLMVSDSIPGLVEFVAPNKDLLEGAFAAEFTVNPEVPKFQEMITLYKEKHGEEPAVLTYAQTEWDSVFILADAIRAVGYDGEKIANWLHSEVKNWQGAAGSVTIGPDGDPVTGHKPEVIRDGKPQPYQL